MPTRFGIGFIGLGSIGQRMLTHASRHERVRAAAVFDPDAGRVAAALERFSELQAAACPTALIQHPEVDVVYVASPPVTHAEHARAALDAGKPVLCEKPLGIDLDRSRALVQHAQRSGVAHAVNFIYASAHPAVVMRDALDSGALGEVAAVDITLHARAWSQRRYAEAPWLAGGAQGGFAREVLSHHLFLCERLFGPARLRESHARFDGDAGAVTQLQARLECGETPVFVRGGTGNVAPDRLEMTLWGARQSLCAYDLHRLRRGTPEGWIDESAAEDAAADWHRRQYDGLAAMLAGQAHPLPDFAAAYSVQALIEAMMQR
jgi:predicted dehydrogenase